MNQVKKKSNTLKYLIIGVIVLIIVAVIGKQAGWIGKSEGCEMDFDVANQIGNNDAFKIKVYTTRPDTIFGVDFLVLAPEHDLVNQITTEAQRGSINEYLTYVKSRSDRDRDLVTPSRPRSKISRV